MVRMQRTPRFPVGTRVLKHFAGYKDPFGGTVDEFLTETGFYHIKYDDGDSEEMTEEDVESHFDAPPATKKRTLAVAMNEGPPPTSILSLSGSPKRKKAMNVVLPPGSEVEDGEDEGGDRERGNEDEDDTGPEASLEEINKLLGHAMSKTVIDGDGNKTTVTGTVSSYFPATKMYRILYFDGTCDDLPYRELVSNFPLDSPVLLEQRKRKAVDGKHPSGPSASPKKPKTFDGSEVGKCKRKDESLTSNMDVPDSIDEEPFVWNKTRAFDTVRKALFVVTSNSFVKAPTKDGHLEILSNNSTTPKKALIQFISAGGMKTLHELLNVWIKNKDTEQGVLLILKILAVIPGVTRDAILSSSIGKKLTAIGKGRCLVNPDPAIPDMANWIIKKWKSALNVDVPIKKDSPGVNDAKDRIRLGNTKPREVEDKRPVSTKSKQDDKPVITPKVSKSANHLKDLLQGPRRGNDVLGNALGGARPSRPLGPAYARRPRKSTVLLDSLAERAIKNTEGEKEPKVQRGAPKVVPDDWVPSKVRFGSFTTLEFNKEYAVSKLLERPPVLPKGPPKDTAQEVTPKDRTKESRPNQHQSESKAKRVSKSRLTLKLPGKSILKARIHVSDGQNNSSISSAEALESGKPIATTEAPTHDSTVNNNDDDSNEHQTLHQDDETNWLPAPPSPPRRRDSSADDVEMPTEVVFVGSPSQATDFTTVGESVAAISNSDDITTESIDILPSNASVASPVVSPDPASSPESGEVTDDGMAPQTPPGQTSPEPPMSPLPPPPADIASTTNSDESVEAVVSIVTTAE